MPFAVELFLDDGGESAVRGIWTALSRSGVASPLPAIGSRPHISLAVYDTLDAEAMIARLEAFASSISALDVVFSSIGIFSSEPAVVFLAPVVTPELLDLHASLHRSLHDTGLRSWDYYLPGRWVPHCALAVDLSPAVVPNAVSTSLMAPLPMQVRLAHVGLVAFRPVQVLCAFPLT